MNAGTMNAGTTSSAANTDEPAASGPPGSGSGTGTGREAFIERLDRIESGLAEFHRRAAHRESVIDRLHNENQELRAGIRRALLDPVVADLLRLFDGLHHEADRLARQGDVNVSVLLASFADDVELALERCGLTVVIPTPGEPFQSGVQVAGAVVPSDDPALHNVVVEVTQVGFRERETGRIRRPARTTVYRVREDREVREPATAGPRAGMEPTAAEPPAVEPTAAEPPAVEPTGAESADVEPGGIPFVPSTAGTVRNSEDV
jgi:molecular chaperone GrpE (heat shock protein)